MILETIRFRTASDSSTDDPWQIVNRIKTMYGTPLIALSADSEKEARARAVGADFFLQMNTNLLEINGKRYLEFLQHLSPAVEMCWETLSK